jgi:hypothetical protein
VLSSFITTVASPRYLLFTEICLWTAIAEVGFAGSSLKLIKLDELESYIGEGWEFVTNLNSDKAIIRLPSH